MEVKCPLRLLQEEELGLTATRQPCEMALWRGVPLGGVQERQALDKVIATHPGPCPANLLAQQMQVRGCLGQAQERELQDTLLLFPPPPQEPQPSHYHLPKA